MSGRFRYIWFVAVLSKIFVSGPSASAIEVPQRNFMPMNRVGRDIGAVTWPNLEQTELELHTRYPRSPETQEESFIFIENFWRNFGIKADEMRTESELGVSDNEENAGDATEDEIGQEDSKISNNENDIDENLLVTVHQEITPNNAGTAGFRYSTHSDSITQYPDQNNQNAAITPPVILVHQYPSLPPPQFSAVPTNPSLQYSRILPVNPSYSGAVPYPQIWNPSRMHGANSAMIDFQPQQYPHSPTAFSLPRLLTSIHPYSMPYNDQFGTPLSSASPPMLQNLPMNANSQNHGSVYPQPPLPHITAYPSPLYSSNPPRSSSSAPQPVPFPTPNVFVNSRQPVVVPTYPYHT